MMVGFALGAMNAADVRIASVSAGRLVVRVPHTRLRAIVEALEAVGFGVDVGGPATTGEV